MAKSLPRRTLNRQSLTEERVRKINTPSSGRLYTYDSTQPGLAICVTSAGTRTFYFAKRIHGRFVRTPIGKVGEVTIQQARDAVVRMLGDAVVRGVDPLTEKHEREAVHARESVTLGQLWTYYLENHAKPHKRSWREDERRYNLHLARWRDWPLAQIDAADIERAHKKLGAKAPYEANRVLSMTHKLFTLAPKVGYDGPNPADGIERFAEDERERFLHADELPRFFTALEALRIKSPTVADALEMCIWTGARKGNVTSMEWAEVNIERALWVIPGRKHKNGKPVNAPLVPQAVEILKRRQADADGPYVFPGRRHGRPIVHLQKRWEELCADACLEELRMHDLRRTAGSWMAAGGTSLHVIGKALGHSSTAATAIYARLDVDPVRAAIERATTAIQAAASQNREKSPDTGHGVPHQPDGVVS